MSETLAVGFFDGVHLGHQSILSGADEVFTFRDHPLSVLAPERAPRLIMSFEDRCAAIHACGVKKVTAIDFTCAFAAQEAKEFAKTFLSGKCIRCGENWCFGRNGKGDAEFLRSLGYDVTVVPSINFEGKPVSSTRIRSALESGKIKDANAMLGRSFQVHGLSFTGKGVGHTLGYPTINLRLEGLLLKLPLGVYVVEVEGVRGIANYGCAPTFGTRAWSEPVLEIHFLNGFSNECDLTSVRTVRLEHFLRPEKKFATLDALKEQIAMDVSALALSEAK